MNYFLVRVADKYLSALPQPKYPTVGETPMLFATSEEAIAAMLHTRNHIDFYNEQMSVVPVTLTEVQQ